MQLVLDPVDHADTVALGIWVPVGARLEEQHTNGISHFLEHMAFKGTQKRSAFDIAQQIESVGGELNAYTSRELTAYYARVMTEDTPLALDILADIVQNTAFDEQELERERGVILQEIAQSIDTPDDIIHDHFQSACYGNTPLGWPILGTTLNVQTFTSTNLRRYMDQHYHPDTMVLSLCGNPSALDKAQEISSRLWTRTDSPPPFTLPAFSYKGGHTYVEKPLEQVHLMLGMEGVSVYHPDRDAIHLWAGILGGGMASRLFQEVREKRGLAYSISCHHQSYKDTGIFNIEVGTAPDTLHVLIEVVARVIRESTQHIQEAELLRIQKQAIAGVVMNRESLLNRCEHQAQHMIYYKRTHTLQEIIDRIQSVTIADVQRVAHSTLCTTLSVAAIGKLQYLPPYEILQQHFQP